MRDRIANAAYLKRWREAHKEEVIAKARAKYAANPTKKKNSAKKWGRSHPDKVKAAHEARRARNPKRWIADHRRYVLKHRYGLAEGVFDELLAKQNGRCALCCAPMDKPCIDHDHVTGSMRELLCHKCNRGLGHFNDDPSLLRSAIAYLEKHARPRQVG